MEKVHLQEWPLCQENLNLMEKIECLKLIETNS